jgi:site-specific DNA-methyltransferase (adenine-specific)
MRLLLGDCLDKLKELEDNSVDSIVTDPPYGLSFMGKKWDYDVPSVEIWQECLRVLKPGGHLLSFAGSRTYHRMAVRIEDAGFEIRDQIMWIYGSGFPKSMDIAKQLDKHAGAERVVVGKREHPTLKDKSKITEPSTASHGGNEWNREWNITAPATDEAKEWDGWGTALKPAHEPIVMARKPFSGTVAQNVLEWGTGGINIDECRIGVQPNDDIFAKNPHTQGGFGHGDATIYGDSSGADNYDPTKGRFPANVIFDKEAGKILDEQTGISKSAKVKNDKGAYAGVSNTGFMRGVSNSTNQYDDIGGASRFFYCPKTSKSDRNEGLDGFEGKVTRRDDGQPYGMNTNQFRPDGSERNPVQPKQNFHPTVKPTDLMAYLIRLVTPKGGVVLDPFMGSGSTGKAAVREGMEFVGIEREKEYFDIAEARIQYEIDRPTTAVKQKIEKKSIENKVVETKYW